MEEAKLYQQVLNSVEEILSKLINTSLPKKEGQRKFGTIRLTSLDMGLPPNKFYIFYLPSQWELENRLFSMAQFRVAVGNYIRKTVWLDCPVGLATIRIPIRETLHLMGFSEEIMPF